MDERRLTRRGLLGIASAAGVAAVAAACRADRDEAGPGAPPPVAVGTPVGRGLTGSIVISYADELGKKPRYVEQAAASLRDAHAAATVTVDLQKVNGNEFYEGTLRRLLAGERADVLHLPGDRIGELADAGLIAPLDDRLEQWPDWRYYPPWVRAGVTYQGRVWAVPYGLDTRFLYFRRDLFERAGLPGQWQPQNVEEILSAAAQVKARVGGVTPYALYGGAAGGTGTANHGFVPLVWAYGGELIDAKGRWIGDSPAIRKALGYYARAYGALGVAPDELLTLPRAWPVMRDRLGQGSAALLFEGGWVYGGWTEKDRAGTEKQVGYLLHPTERGGQSFTIGGSGTCWFIAAQSGAPDLAWEYIKAFNNRETVARLNAEDPHPVARVDAVRVPEFSRDPFLVYSTNSLERARFVPPDANYGKVVTAMQVATQRVATGEQAPEQAAGRYAEDLAALLGGDRVVTEG